MADHTATPQPAATGRNSHAAAPEPSGDPRIPPAQSKSQTPLDESPAVPLHVRPVLTYLEVAALGISPERSLRRLVAIGRVRRSVLRAGRRVRFVKDILLEELREAEA